MQLFINHMGNGTVRGRCYSIPSMCVIHNVVKPENGADGIHISNLKWQNQLFKYSVTWLLGAVE